MKLEKLITDAEKSIDEMMDNVKEPMSKVVEFIKEHKKIIFILITIYALYSYLFDETN